MVWKKRGEAESLLYDTFLDIVMVILIAVVVFASVQSVEDNTLHQQRVAARDLALVRDVALAAAGEVYYPFAVQKGLTANMDAACKVVVTADAKERPGEIFFCGESADARLQVRSQKQNPQIVEVEYVRG